MNETSIAKFSVQIMDKTNEFIINEGASLVCTGRISCPDLTEDKFLEFQDDLMGSESKWDKSNDLVLNNKEVYKELRIRGYDYGNFFQGLVEANGDGTKGK